MVNEKDLLEKP